MAWTGCRQNNRNSNILREVQVTSLLWTCLNIYSVETNVCLAGRRITVGVIYWSASTRVKTESEMVHGQSMPFTLQCLGCLFFIDIYIHTYCCAAAGWLRCILTLSWDSSILPVSSWEHLQPVCEIQWPWVHHKLWADSVREKVADRKKS